MKQMQKLSQEQKKIVLDVISNRTLRFNNEGNIRNANILSRAFDSIVIYDGDLRKLTKAQLRLISDIVASQMVVRRDNISYYSREGYNDYVKMYQEEVEILENILQTVGLLL
jgi:hypothetical protein